MVKSLNNLSWFRDALVKARAAWLKAFVGVDLGADIKLSLSARLVPGRRGSIRVGDHTLIAFKTLIFTFDPFAKVDRPVHIGRHCFIGGGSVILPGVTIGDESIVGANAVVFESVPPQTVVGGNPAVVLRRNIKVGLWGRMEGADENTRRMWDPPG